MNYKKLIPLALFSLLLALPFASAIIYDNGTVACDPADTHGYCHMIEAPSAGIGLFFQYLTSPLGSLLFILALIGVMAAIGFAIAHMVKHIM
jgi:hypothetical protein